MGEQTPSQPQSQVQSQPSNDSSSTPTQAQTLSEDPINSTTAAVSTVNTVSTAVVASPSMELINVPLQTSSPPSKIPSRPRKIRKLSSDPKSDPDALQQATTTTSSASVTVPLKTVAKTPKTKLTQHRALAVVASRIIARSLSCDGEVETAIRHLRNADTLLASLIDLYPPPTFDTFHTPFLALTRSILYQQLALKAGTSIYSRFISLCGGENGVVPETVLSLTPQQLRQIGVSGRKASYLHDLARKYQTGILSDSSIVNMDDKSLFTMLTMVNGIGSWSVHMFMINSLHRPDVLPNNDLGVRKGVQMLYNLEELPRPSQMDQLCEKWRPYRSVASWYLSRFVETKGAPSSASVFAAGVSLQPQQQEEQQQHQQQPQLLDPINSILNLGRTFKLDSHSTNLVQSLDNLMESYEVSSLSLV